MMAMGKIRVGTCSWSERSLIESGEFYPKGVSSPEDRLRFYASQFDTVEVDSSYYAIPAIRTTEQWAERTPQAFTFHVKAYGALTGHGIAPKTLPKELREMLPVGDKEKKNIFIKEPVLLKAISDAFVSALAPPPCCWKTWAYRLPVSAMVLVYDRRHGRNTQAQRAHG